MFGKSFRQLIALPRNAKFTPPLKRQALFGFSVEIAAARQLALQILDAADAANSDAFLVGFFGDTLKADGDMQGAMLACFREYREKKAGAA